MDDSQTHFLKELVARFLQSAREYDSVTRDLEVLKARQEKAKEQKWVRGRMLQIEGIDPDNIPPEYVGDKLIEFQMQGVISDDAWLDETPEPAQRALRPSENNGRTQTSEWPQPINETHVVFLVFKNLENPWLSSEEIYQKNIDFGYGLPKSEIVRILGRQMSRPQKMFEKDGDKYRLTPLGLAFEGFRRKTTEKAA